MTNKLRLAIASFISALMLAAGFTVATPAQAAFGGLCSANSFCLYQWTGLGAQVENNRWQSSYGNFIGHSGGCIDLSGPTWANGTPVNNNSGSLMWRTTVGGWEQYAITVFNWANCNTAGQWEVIGYLGSAGSQFSYDNLSNYDYSDSGSAITLYHTISSISIRRVL